MPVGRATIVWLKGSSVLSIMVSAARAQGIPMIVMNMITAAISQPIAISRPPSTIKSTFNKRLMPDMASALAC